MQEKEAVVVTSCQSIFRATPAMKEAWPRMARESRWCKLGCVGW